MQYEVPFDNMMQAENELTAWFAKRYGWHGVRGGDFTFAKLHPLTKDPLPMPDWVFERMAAYGDLRQPFGTFSAAF
jgi:hypothetical protein